MTVLIVIYLILLHPTQASADGVMLNKQQSDSSQDWTLNCADAVQSYNNSLLIKLLQHLYYEPKCRTRGVFDSFGIQNICPRHDIRADIVAELYSFLFWRCSWWWRVFEVSTDNSMHWRDHDVLKTRLRATYVQWRSRYLLRGLTRTSHCIRIN